MSGGFRKLWEVDCGGCESVLPLRRREKHDAMAEARASGWGMRRGHWYCRQCKDDPDMIGRHTG